MEAYGSSAIDCEDDSEPYVEAPMTVTIDSNGQCCLWLSPDGNPKWTETIFDEEGSEIDMDAWAKGTVHGAYQWLSEKGCETWYKRRFDVDLDPEKDVQSCWVRAFDLHVFTCFAKSCVRVHC